eukprot:CAMPEP_0198729108 /NCGR_PEP_ID=MMETSP1475-20131203/14884_1 /TAXON_ID= ORGANISM="Unidentified sp., Strain CCMP1999" /NCGR_SAMPLE_ID=MMETSP1475 /ASSEMBLY_ACC=CAM_ASM_001111 /LENGTH=542 /DNA_ID=CAMNT_0044491677 /DNA_START=169 /DNA_END=1795 /DNA_ORIENTATION=+
MSYSPDRRGGGGGGAGADYEREPHSRNGRAPRNDDLDNRGPPPGDEDLDEDVDEDPPVYVGNFEYSTTTDDLERAFDRLGPIRKIDMKSGFAFVFMKYKEDGDELIRLFDRTPFGSKQRVLRVEWARGDGRVKQRERKRRMLGTKNPTDTLFVVSFDPSTTRERDLEDFFSNHGRVENLEIRSTYAFIQFASVDDAVRALTNCHDAEFRGRRLTVEYKNGPGRTIYLASETAVRGGGAIAEAREAGHDMMTGRLVAHSVVDIRPDVVGPPRVVVTGPPRVVVTGLLRVGVTGLLRVVAAGPLRAAAAGLPCGLAAGPLRVMAAGLLSAAAVDHLHGVVVVLLLEAVGHFQARIGLLRGACGLLHGHGSSHQMTATASGHPTIAECAAVAILREGETAAEIGSAALPTEIVSTSEQLAYLNTVQTHAKAASYASHAILATALRDILCFYTTVRAYRQQFTAYKSTICPQSSSKNFGSVFAWLHIALNPKSVAAFGHFSAILMSIDFFRQATAPLLPTSPSVAMLRVALFCKAVGAHRRDDPES